HPTVQPAVQPGIVEAVSAVVARDDVDRRVAGTWIVRTTRRCRPGNRSAFARTAVPRNAGGGVAAVLLSAAGAARGRDRAAAAHGSGSRARMTAATAAVGAAASVGAARAPAAGSARR